MQHYAWMGYRELPDQKMADRLKLAREHAGYEHASDAARAMGIAVPTYLGHENASRGFLKATGAYARHFKVRWLWLVRNEGPMTTAEARKLGTLDERVGRLEPDDQQAIMSHLQALERPKS